MTIRRPSLQLLPPIAVILCWASWAVRTPAVESTDTPRELAPPALAFGQSVDGISDEELPYVYTRWKNYTVKDGLPNDHIFSVKATAEAIWIGTEDGLARLDRKTDAIQSWKEADGLPWRAITSIDVDPKTGDVWLGLFGGGLARFSGGRFDHFHQLNSGLVNDVVYGVAVENNHVWCATTAGASRYDILTGKWDVFTEKNAPMEEIWNYNVTYAPAINKVFLAVWGSGCLEFDVPTEKWKVYLDPDKEMEIDLYRDDGIVHVITTAASYADGALWVSTYFGNCRYDGRHWRGFYAHETGIPSDFTNFLKGRSADEAWLCTDKGLGVVAHYPTDTYVAYYRNADDSGGTAKIFRRGRLLREVPLEVSVAHNFMIGVDFDGDDVWVATAHGLSHGIGRGYYPGVKKISEWPHAVAAAPVESNDPQEARKARNIGSRRPR